MFGLLYYGRLEKEKGFDAILEMINTLQTKGNENCPEFFIFGAGSLEKELLPLTKQKNVHYFGWQPLKKIKQYLENINYCLMPSEFLETFGLSALNALSRGIPVIGYKKG
jgi:glycosyltransferase involved in cell wall biosynthesis